MMFEASYDQSNNRSSRDPRTHPPLINPAARAIDQSKITGQSIVHRSLHPGERILEDAGDDALVRNDDEDGPTVSSPW
jgi:hypothetical protein